MSAGKRKRLNAGDAAFKKDMAWLFAGKPPARKQFRPGRDRIGGYYGRYAGRDGELKFHDVALDDAVVSATGGITPTLIIIPQGVTESNRVGRKCTLKSVHCRYRITLPTQDAQGTPAFGDTIRTIIYVDKQCNGATAAITDILEAANVQSFRNLANSGRFTFLCDKLQFINYSGLASDNAGVVSQAGVSHSYVWNKRLNMPIEYDSTTGAITEIRSNNVSILLLSAHGICGFSSEFRFRFSDR